MLSFVLPNLFYIKLHQSKLSAKQIAVHWAIILVGVIGGLISASDVLLEEEDD
jgi:hypothetical protein